MTRMMASPHRPGAENGGRTAHEATAHAVSARPGARHGREALDCVPTAGGGAWITYGLIHRDSRRLRAADLGDAHGMVAPWLRHVGGRLKSDYRYSIGLVYNTFPTLTSCRQPCAAPTQASTGRWTGSTGTKSFPPSANGSSTCSCCMTGCKCRLRRRRRTEDDEEGAGDDVSIEEVIPLQDGRVSCRCRPPAARFRP